MTINDIPIQKPKKLLTCCKCKQIKYSATKINIAAKNNKQITLCNSCKTNLLEWMFDCFGDVEETVGSLYEFIGDKDWD